MKLTISKLIAIALISANGIHGSELRGSIEESKARDVELSEVDAADVSNEIDLDSSSSAGATRWYTNWDYCVQDCREKGGSCCGGTAKSYDTTFTSAAACCNQSALKWNYDNCVAESTRCTDNDNGGRRRPSDGNRDTGPCSYNEIFSDYNVRTRASMTRSARAGTLKQDYPEVWKDTKKERNQCKKAVGANECKKMGLCGEAEFEEVKMVKIDLDSSSSAGATRWYTNWDYCVQDCREKGGSCCGGTAKSYDTTFTSAAACCNQSALKWNYDNCVAESTRCTDNDNGGRRRPSDGNRDTGPCSYNEIFSDYNVRTRASMTRSARAGTLKQDYPEVWKDTKKERNQCKKSVGANECKKMGLCGEAEFEEAKLVKIE